MTGAIPTRFLRPLALLLLLILPLLLAAGCSDDELSEGDTTEETAGETTTSEPGDTTTSEGGETNRTTAEGETSALELAQECSNELYSVSYPEGWVTNEQAVDSLPACSLFDPESVELGETLQVPESIAVFLRVEEVAFAATNQEDSFEEELAREGLVVAGQAAVRAESRATGEGFRPQGMLTTSYLVNLEGRTFVATTHDTGELDYETKQDVLDRMMETLQFTEAALGSGG